MGHEPVHDSLHVTYRLLAPGTEPSRGPQPIKLNFILYLFWMEEGRGVRGDCTRSGARSLEGPSGYTWRRSGANLWYALEVGANP